MSKIFYSLFAGGLCLLSAGIHAQTIDSVNFNTYVSATNNDLANKFTGTYTMTQQTTDGITGGSVVPSATVGTSNDAFYNKQYGLYLTAANPVAISVCFKYSAAAATDGKPGPQVGLVLQNDSFSVYTSVRAYLAYSSDLSASNLFITATGQNNSNAQFTVTDGHWYKFELTAQATNADTTNASVYLYDIGAAGTSAPVLVNSFLNQKMATLNITARHSYLNAVMNGGADGGVLYLDDFSVDGYYYTTGIETVELEKHITMPTVVTNNLTVTTDLANDIQYAIYNTGGVTIKKGSFNKTGNIDISTLPPANYLVRFLSNGETTVRKFVKW